MFLRTNYLKEQLGFTSATFNYTNAATFKAVGLEELAMRFIYFLLNVLLIFLRSHQVYISMDKEI